MKTNTLQQFSWNRVRVALIFFDKSDGFFMKDGTLVLPFLRHRHELWVYPNGRGMLYNPWQEEDVRYFVLPPRDIQQMIVDVRNSYTQAIQNKDLN